MAALEIAKDSDNVIKVATMLGRIKRWISSMFSPAISRQVEEISGKHAEIKYLIEAVNADIKGIEDAIESVDIVTYDYKVKDLLTSISALNKKLSEMQGVIFETQKEIKEETKEKQPRKGVRIGRSITKGPLLEKYTPGKELKDIGLSVGEISFPADRFYLSFASEKFKGFGKGGVLGLENSGFDTDQINQIIQNIKDNKIFDSIIKKDLPDYKIIGLYNRPINDENKQFECIIRINGDSKFNVDGMGVFVVNTSFDIGILSISRALKKAMSLRIIVEDVQPITTIPENKVESEPESEPETVELETPDESTGE